MKKFLVVFKLPQPRLEHAQSKKDLEAYSRGNCQLAFSWVDADKAGLIGYVFTTDAPLLEIANEVGFESTSVFHEQFRRLNGLTPGAYRRRFKIPQPSRMLCCASSPVPI